MKIVAAVTAVLLSAVPALASNDEAAELWLNPSATVDLDDSSSFEFETAQRLRDSEDGRSDTYFYRAWLNRDVAADVTLSGAIERRVNTDGDADETRVMQQVSTSRGIWRTRLRLEQRFVDDADRTGLRLRPRVGLSVPIGASDRWRFKSDAELFLTLVSTNKGADHGLTALRTQIGFSYRVSERLTLSAAYLRQQTFDDAGPDEVGHAPILGLEYTF
jgi:hypothetical protein